MFDYKNKQELQKAINEGYFSVNTYEKTSQKAMLLEKVLNMAKNDKDDIFKQLAVLAEEVISDESTLSSSVDIDDFITKSKSEADMKSAVLDKLPMTTLAIKKLDGENIESLKWLLVKKLGATFDKRRIFDLTDCEFKKMLCALLRNEDTSNLKTNEVEFTDKAIDNNTVEPLIESYIKYAGQSIKEEMAVSENEDDNNYYYLIKKQIDSMGDSKLKQKIEAAYSTISLDSVEKDPIDMIDEVPEKIKDRVQLAYIKDIIHRDDFTMEESPEKDPLETHEDSEFSELVEADEELSKKKLSTEDQIKRQEALSEELKQLYIIKKTKESIMLESSHVLRDINYKKALLSRTLLYEEALGNREKKKYCEKLMKINTLTECLVRKYIPIILG